MFNKLLSSGTCKVLDKNHFTRNQIYDALAEELNKIKNNHEL